MSGAPAARVPDAVRVGVIGVGGIGHTHLRAYAAAGNPVVAVTDVDADRARAAADEFGATAYPDLATLLAGADVSAVSVCTPPSGHLPSALAALEAGVAVLCEKPMAITVADCERMRAAAQAAAVPLAVGFCHRYQPQIQAMRAIAERGDIGTVLAFVNEFSGPLDGVENRWFSRPEIAGGGVLTDTCVHSVDLFRYLVGDIADVRALTATTATERGPALDVEDSGMLTLRSTNGVLGSVVASWRVAPGHARVGLRGTAGELVFDYGTGALTQTMAGAAPQQVQVDDGDRFTRQAAAFLTWARGGAPTLATADDGVAAADALSRAYASAG